MFPGKSLTDTYSNGSFCLTTRVTNDSVLNRHLTTFQVVLRDFNVRLICGYNEESITYNILEL